MHSHPGLAMCRWSVCLLQLYHPCSVPYDCNYVLWPQDRTWLMHYAHTHPRVLFA